MITPRVPLQMPAEPLPAVTKLVAHSIHNEAFLIHTFPSLRALSCDAADTGLKHLAELVSSKWSNDLLLHCCCL